MSIFTEKPYNKMKAVLAEKKSNGEMSIPDSSSPIVPDEKAEFTFAVFGDPQVSNYMHARQKCFCSCCLDLANMNEELDALVLAGDIAENGMNCEYRLAADILNEHCGKVKNIILIPGNHDTRLHPYKKQMNKFKAFVRTVDKAVPLTGEHYYHSCEIGGYKCIMLGPDMASFEGSYLSDQQLEWLDKELSECEPGKPVFVFNHQTLKLHNGLPHTWVGIGNWRGSVGWQSDKLKAVFEKYNNVLFITGHLHFGTNACSFEDHGKYKALAAQTVGAHNDGDYDEDCQGFVVSVYKDKVTIRARVFGKGIYVPEEIPGAYAEYAL